MQGSGSVALSGNDGAQGSCDKTYFRIRLKLWRGISVGFEGGRAAFGDFAQMIDEETVEELADFGKLGGAEAEAEDGRPVELSQARKNVAGAGSKWCLSEIGLQSKVGEEFEFEGENGLRLGGVERDLGKQLGELGVENRKGRFGFGVLFDERGGVGGLLKPGEVASELGVGRDGFGFPEVVKFRARAAGETKV